MGRVTEIGSLINSPIAELQGRGEKMLREAIKKAGSLVGAAEALSVSRRQLFRWAAKLGIDGKPVKWTTARKEEMSVKIKQTWTQARKKRASETFKKLWKTRKRTGSKRKAPSA